MAGFMSECVEAILAGMLALSGVEYVSHAERAALAQRPPPARVEAMRIHLGKGEGRAELVFVAERGSISPVRRTAPARVFWQVPEPSGLVAR